MYSTCIFKCRYFLNLGFSHTNLLKTQCLLKIMIVNDTYWKLENISILGRNILKKKTQLNKNILIMFTQCTCYMYEYHSFYSPVFLVLSFQKVLVLVYEAFNKNYYTKIILHVHNYVLEIKIHVHFKNTIL